MLIERLPAINNANNNNDRVNEIVENSDSNNNADLIKVNVPSKQKTEIGEKALNELFKKANESLNGPPTTLEFSVHKATQTIAVKILNKDTGQVIREIPSEKILDLVAKLMEMAGIIVDKKI